MERSDFFDKAPDLNKDFNEKADGLQPSTDSVNTPSQDEVEHLDLADRPYTPGGDLEYRVHKEVRVQRSTQWLEKGETPSLKDEQELDFDGDFQKAANPSFDSPDKLRDEIDQQINEMGPEFDRAAGPDREGPDR